MKLSDVLLEYRTPKKPKARPKKTLWFNVPQLWKHDLDMTYPNHKLYYDEEEETFYALDDPSEKCYGAWYGKKKNGVTFAAPRPKNVTIHPRQNITPYVQPTGINEMKLSEMARRDDPTVRNWELDKLPGDGRGGVFFNAEEAFVDPTSGFEVMGWDGYDVSPNWDDFGSQYYSCWGKGTKRQVLNFIREHFYGKGVYYETE